MSAYALSSVWGVNLEFTSKRQRRRKLFHDELPADSRLNDPVRIFKVKVFYKLIDVAINQLEWRFEGQRQVAGLFTFLFPEEMLSLTDEEQQKLKLRNFKKSMPLISVKSS